MSADGGQAAATVPAGEAATGEDCEAPVPLPRMNPRHETSDQQFIGPDYGLPMPTLLPMVEVMLDLTPAEFDQIFRAMMERDRASFDYEIFKSMGGKPS
jgi:hypothetical protein